MKLFDQIKEKKYWLLGLFVACVLLTSVKPFSTYRDRAYRQAKREWLILTGGMIDVGGYYVRVECWGSGRTVVFESGLSQPRETWGTVPSEVAKIARVCTYDRAGVAESDDANFKRKSSDLVRELRILLQKEGEKDPVVLVGHSFGGLNARMYAMSYPGEVAGLVLVDPSHEDQYVKMAEAKQAQEREEYLRHESGDNGEGVDILASADELQNTSSRVTVPTIVLTADSNQFAYLYDRLFTTGANYNSGGSTIFSEHIVVPNSGHFIQTDHPDVVVSAVTKMIGVLDGDRR